MMTPTLFRLPAVFFAGVAMIASALAADAPKVVPMGDNTYSIMHQAPTTFQRDVAPLRAAVKADAEKFCAEQGKQMKVLTLTSYKPRFISGYANAKIVFKALDAGDPELTSQPAAAAGSAGIVTGDGPDDMYSELLKLDDLHKKGILTDDEFTKQKKRILKRYK